MDLSQGVPSGHFPHSSSKGIWAAETVAPSFFSQPLIASVLATIKRRKVRRRGGLPCSSCNIPPPHPKTSSQPPSPAGYSQTPCPQHSHPSQTQAPVNTGSPCDYTRLGTGRGENQASLLFQQVWITQSILPPNLLLLLLYSSHSEASLLSHTLGTLTFDSQ